MDTRLQAGIRSLLKAAVVSLAIRGLCPRAVARWLIQRGGLRDA